MNTISILPITLDTYLCVSPSDPRVPTWRKSLQHKLEELACTPEFLEYLFCPFHPAQLYTGRHKCRSVASPITYQNVLTIDSFGDVQHHQTRAHYANHDMDDKMSKTSYQIHYLKCYTAAIEDPIAVSKRQRLIHSEIQLAENFYSLYVVLKRRKHQTREEEIRRS